MPDEEPPIITGESLTEEDKFWLAWAKESIKANFQLANDVLKQIVTLSSTLLGAGVIFLNKDTLPSALIAPIMILFLVAVIVSFLGVLPYEAQVNLNNIDAIKNHKKASLHSKTLKIYWSAIAFFLGLLLAIIGMAWKTLS